MDNGNNISNHFFLNLKYIRNVKLASNFNAFVCVFYMNFSNFITLELLIISISILKNKKLNVLSRYKIENKMYKGNLFQTASQINWFIIGFTNNLQALFFFLFYPSQSRATPLCLD